MSNEMQLVDDTSAAHPAPMAQPLATTPMQLLSVAVARGASIEEIGKFMDLMERQDANEARKAFVAAMAAFKKSPPTIYKDKDVRFTTGKGPTAYAHATLGNVCRKIIEALAAHGISHAWAIEQTGARIRVTCSLTHERGHSTSTSLEASPDDSAGKNAIQAVGSTITYLERYTLLASCGMSVQEWAPDDDGAGASQKDNAPAVQELPRITDERLSKAIDSIQAGDYTYEKLVATFALTGAQLERARDMLRIKA